MSAQASNLEEAANVAAEFIYNIDNLPHEVNHILQEIKIRETKVQELQQEIDRDTIKYIRHYRRSSAVSPSPPSPTSKSNSREQTPSGTSSSTAQIPAKVNSLYTQLSDLANEKCLLAERLIELILRTRSKLDAELGKVKLLQGEASEAVAASNSTEMIAPALALAMAQSPAGTGYGLSQANQAGLFGVGNGLGRSASVDSNAFALNAGGRNPALAISESLRNALSMASPSVSLSAPVVATSSTPASTVTATSGHATKKRKLAASASGTIKISTAGSHSNRNSRSSSPAVTIPAVTQTKKSSRSSRLRERVEEDEEEEEAVDEVAMDTEGVGELDDDAEDETLYCFCQKQSYGDMIACDNEGGCPFEWFHLACVGLKQPTPEKWYCSVCTKEMGLSTSTPGATVGRKGRKK